MRKFIFVFTVLAMAIAALGVATPAAAQFEKADVWFTVSTWAGSFAGSGQKIPVNIVVGTTSEALDALDIRPTGLITVGSDGADEICVVDLMDWEGQPGASRAYCELIFNQPGSYYLYVSYEGDYYHNSAYAEFTDPQYRIIIRPSYTFRVRSTAQLDGWLRGKWAGVTASPQLEPAVSIPLFKNIATNNTGSYFRVGDDASNRTFFGLLSFNTAAVPDGAQIYEYHLKIRTTNTNGVVGSPVGAIHSIVPGYYGDSKYLETKDMNDARMFNNLAPSSVYPVVTGLWWSYDFAILGLGNDTLSGWMIDPMGITQVGLLPGLSTSQGHILYLWTNAGFDDYYQFYTGEAAQAYRPYLEVVYFTP